MWFIDNFSLNFNKGDKKIFEKWAYGPNILHSRSGWGARHSDTQKIFRLRKTAFFRYLKLVSLNFYKSTIKRRKIQVWIESNKN